MTAAAALLANLFLSVAALAGLWALHGVIAAQGSWAPLNRRFLFGLRVTMLLFAGRALAVITGVGAFRVLELVAAALIPLAVLILTEGLLRRHAPRGIKWAVAAGAVLFGLWALWPALAEPLRWRGLLGYQLGTLALCGAMVWRRDTATLSLPEDRAAGRLGLSLLALVPLAGADFMAESWGLPVQPSGLAVLFLCGLAVGLSRGEADHAASLGRFAVVLGGALAVTGVLALGWAMPWRGAILTGAVVAAAMLATAILAEARQVRQEAGGLSLVRLLAEPGRDAAAFLRGVQGHPLVEGAVRIDLGDLADLDPAVLARTFGKRPVVRRNDPPGEADDADEADHLGYLFDRFDASHLLLIAERPMAILALAVPSVAASARTEMELAAVQRMAVLMARGDG